MNLIITNKEDLSEIIRIAISEILSKFPADPSNDSIEIKPGKLYSIKELAGFLHVSATTAQKYKNEGAPCIQYGRKLIFDTHDVLEWLNSRKKGRATTWQK